MSQHNIKVEITVATQTVAIADVPTHFQVSISGGSAPVVIPVPSATYEANFVVEVGSYTGTAQAFRADGTGIGSPIEFTAEAADPAPTTAEAPVASGVTVTVTPVVPAPAPAA